MEKTLKKDNERKIIRSEYINDNMILEFVTDSNDENVTAVVRYIDSDNSIKETVLIKNIAYATYVVYINQLLRIAEDKKHITIFKKEGSTLVLDRIYDVEEHSMIPEDFLDVVFKKIYPTEELGLNKVLVKTQYDGGALYWQA